MDGYKLLILSLFVDSDLNVMLKYLLEANIFYVLNPGSVMFLCSDYFIYYQLYDWYIRWAVE